MPVTLRAATPEDTTAVRDLVRSAYALYVERMDREPAPMQADYSALVARGAVTIAELEGEMAGVLVCYARGDALHVENVAVSPAFQRKGVGAELMAAAQVRAMMMQLSSIELYTNEVMTENLPFYERLGYSIRERARQDGYARIFFEKKLGPAKSG